MRQAAPEISCKAIRLLTSWGVVPHVASHIPVREELWEAIKNALDKAAWRYETIELVKHDPGQ